jgi:dihydrodipicolinate synthase/N-acetylneuraminate lyase
MQTLELSIAVNKHLLASRGVISSARLRAPGRPLDRFHQAQLRACLDALNNTAS